MKNPMVFTQIGTALVTIHQNGIITVDGPDFKRVTITPGPGTEAQIGATPTNDRDRVIGTLGLYRTPPADAGIPRLNASR